MQAVGEIAEFPSFAKRAYPCWVMSLTNLAAFEELPEHEECIEKLEELLPDSTSPSCAYSFFISQNWEGGRPGPSGQGYFNVRGRPHPDNKLNTKIRWLKRCAARYVLWCLRSAREPQHNPTSLFQDPAAYETATRPPDMGLVRSRVNSSALTRSTAGRDWIPLRLHSTLHKVVRPRGAWPLRTETRFTATLLGHLCPDPSP